MRKNFLAVEYWIIGAKKRNAKDDNTWEENLITSLVGRQMMKKFLAVDYCIIGTKRRTGK